VKPSLSAEAPSVPGVFHPWVAPARLRNTVAPTVGRGETEVEISIHTKRPKNRDLEGH